MKMKNIQLLSLLLCTLTSQAWGMRENLAQAPHSLEPVTKQPTDALTKEFKEEQRLLQEHQKKTQNTTTTATPAVKPGFLKNLLTKLTGGSQKPTTTTTPVVESGPNDLTPDEQKILEELRAKHERLDTLKESGAQGAGSETQISYQKKTATIKAVLKTALKKENPNLSPEQIDSYVKELNRFITDNAKQPITVTSLSTDGSQTGNSNSNITAEDVRLTNIRQKMHDILIEAKQAKQPIQKQNPAKKDVAPPFKKETEKKILSINDEFSNLIMERNASADDKEELLTIQKTLNDAIQEIRNQKPTKRDWLFRKNKWSKEQETEVSTALETAQTKLNEWNVKQKFSKTIANIVKKLTEERSIATKGREMGYDTTMALTKMTNEAKIAADSATTEDAKETIIQKLEKDIRTLFELNKTESTNTSNGSVATKAKKDDAVIPVTKAVIQNPEHSKPDINAPAKPGVIETRDLTDDEIKKGVQLSPDAEKKNGIILSDAVTKYGLQNLEKTLLDSITTFKQEKPKTYRVNITDSKNPTAGATEETVISPDLKAWNKANREIEKISSALDKQIRSIYFDLESSPARDLKPKFYSSLTKSGREKVEAERVSNNALAQIEGIIGAYKKTQALAYAKRNPKAQAQKKSLNG
jgi:hypothetical protein